ncbi:peptidase U32 family protein [Allofustis seminis]|uniref:peptidase U32 family protein n=1 Tax=Allofustis seminis TaxID=166939 RepID=UPI00036EA6E2|nr:peptidase U32 family protein [Allofustis seminis]
MIQLITYPKSVAHAKDLLKYSDILVIGEDQFGVELPANFTRNEQQAIIELAHEAHKKVVVAVNGMMHNEDIEDFHSYLPFLYDVQIDAIMTGDPGIVQVMRDAKMEIPMIWDAQTLNTSSGNLNFWGKRGAIGAVLARELPQDELQILMKKIEIPVSIQVYGASGIHQSLRNLVFNYLDYLDVEAIQATREEPLYITPSRQNDKRYTIYEDQRGTHIFASDDLNLLPVLDELVEMNLTHWSLNSLFVEPEAYTEVVSIFKKAADLLSDRKWSAHQVGTLSQMIETLHPKQRTLNLGFYELSSSDIR